MPKIEIVEKEVEDNIIIQLSKKQIFEIIEKDGALNFLLNYDIDENFIYINRNIFPKEVVIEVKTLSEFFIIQALQEEYFTLEDLSKLNSNTYFNLTDSFITEYSNHLDWAMILTLKSTQTDDFDKCIGIIDRKNLWGYISANDLSIEFIRNWKHKLDWRYLSLVKEFTTEEKSEFSDYIVSKTIDLDNLSTVGTIWNLEIGGKILESQAGPSAEIPRQMERH